VLKGTLARHIVVVDALVRLLVGLVLLSQSLFSLSFFLIHSSTACEALDAPLKDFIGGFAPTFLASYSVRSACVYERLCSRHS
jgi:hypothetical protein